LSPDSYFLPVQSLYLQSKAFFSHAYFHNYDPRHLLSPFSWTSFTFLFLRAKTQQGHRSTLPACSAPPYSLRLMMSFSFSLWLDELCNRPELSCTEKTPTGRLLRRFFWRLSPLPKRAFPSRETCRTTAPPRPAKTSLPFFSLGILFSP